MDPLLATGEGQGRQGAASALQYTLATVHVLKKVSFCCFGLFDVIKDWKGTDGGNLNRIREHANFALAEIRLFI